MYQPAGSEHRSLSPDIISKPPSTRHQTKEVLYCRTETDEEREGVAAEKSHHGYPSVNSIKTCYQDAQLEESFLEKEEMVEDVLNRPSTPVIGGVDWDGYMLRPVHGEVYK